MEAEMIQRGIASFPRWHYQFDLQGQATPIFDVRHANRHQQRKRYFFEPLVQLFGGSLRGLRVLDLGCNAGYWSLCAIEAGCEHVVGIDGRQMHIDQANFVFSVKNVDRSRYEFVTANLFEVDLEAFGQFDIVLCLGLLYHVSKPMELLEAIARVNTDVLVIDTALSLAPGHYLEVYRDRLDEPRNAVDYEVVLWPTREAVGDMARALSYSVAVLKPQFDSYVGALDYRLRARRCFLCSKHTDLARLPAATEGNGLLARSFTTALWSVQKLTPFVPQLVLR